MKAVKFFSIAAVAALLLMPATAMAKTHFSVSLNLFDCLVPRLMPAPVVVVPQAPPVYYYVPRLPLPPPPPRVIVKEIHYYPAPKYQKEVKPDYYFHIPQER